MKHFYIISGGTLVHIAPHFSLTAPAYGKVGRMLQPLFTQAFANVERNDVHIDLLLTRMAMGGNERSNSEKALLAAAGLVDLCTNEDMMKLIDHLISLPDTCGIVMATALCDFQPTDATFNKETHPRLDSQNAFSLDLQPTEKIVQRIRKTRKDIFLVGFKTTADANPHEQYIKGLRLLKSASCNLVLANDIRTGLNMVITPEQARYHEGMDREATLKGLAEMTALRSNLTFTRSTIVSGESVPWSSPLIPETLRIVVNHCISRHAYKPFLGSTVGHFAVKIADGSILTSRRKTNFNNLSEIGLVRIEPHGQDAVIAYGSKPSVGGQSQRIIFTEHADLDCIVHFHCPLRLGSTVPIKSQRAYECGSHECGKNTSNGLKNFDRIFAVMLDKHGPNIVFHHDANPQEVISFIENNFDLEGRTDDIPEFFGNIFSLADARYVFA